MKARSFSEYVSFLRENVENLSQYWATIEHTQDALDDIIEALDHNDPFIVYKGSIAASLLLKDRSIYH